MGRVYSRLSPSASAPNVKPATAPLYRMLLALTLLLAATTGAAAGEAEHDVERAMHDWVDAYNSRDAARIAAQYAPDALFWGTRSAAIATEPVQIGAYFQESARNPNLRVAVNERHVHVYGNLAVAAGIYTVTDVKDGRDVSTPGRFTFVFEKRGERWVIVHHHSSRMPSH
jgi:uncharacterized protein (TIGR02246 family)